MVGADCYMLLAVHFRLLLIVDMLNILLDCTLKVSDLLLFFCVKLHFIGHHGLDARIQ